MRLTWTHISKPPSGSAVLIGCTAIICIINRCGRIKGLAFPRRFGRAVFVTWDWLPHSHAPDLDTYLQTPERERCADWMYSHHMHYQLLWTHQRSSFSTPIWLGCGRNM